MRGTIASCIVVGILLIRFPLYGQQSTADTPQLQETPLLKVVTDVVNIYAVVRDQDGRLVRNLEREEFELQEENQQQDIRYFSRDVDTPLSLAILIDTSRSQEKTLGIEQENAKSFVREVVRPKDLALVEHFDVEVDINGHLTADHDLLNSAIDQLEISGIGRGESLDSPVRIPFPGPPTPVPGPFPTFKLGYTHLLDAVCLAAKQLSGEIGRRAILLIGDGVDIGSRADVSSTLQAVQRSDAIVYCLNVADKKLHTHG